MKLKDQVCSLKLAKRLKELGVKQESLFYWSTYDNEWELITDEDRLIDPDDPEFKYCSAFTVAELDNIILNTRVTESMFISYLRFLKRGQLIDVPDFIGLITMSAEDKAEFVVYLIENKIVSVT